MRIVIYDNEMMEPIVVVNMPAGTDGFLQHIEHVQQIPELIFPVKQNGNSIIHCRVRFEAIHKFNQGVRIRKIWVCSAMDAETALLIRSTFLSDQRQDAREADERTFMRAITAAMGIT